MPYMFNFPLPVLVKDKPDVLNMQKVLHTGLYVLIYLLVVVPGYPQQHWKSLCKSRYKPNLDLPLSSNPHIGFKNLSRAESGGPHVSFSQYILTHSDSLGPVTPIW